MNDKHTLRDELEDRLAEQALGELLGGKRPPDLSERILAAAAQPAVAKRKLRVRLALAATVLVVVALGAAYARYQRFRAPNSIEDSKRLVAAKGEASGSKSKPTAEPIQFEHAAGGAAKQAPQNSAQAPQTSIEGEKLALLVDEFNRLMDEHRYAEAEVIAKQAKALAPDEPIAKQIALMVKMVGRTQDPRDIRDAEEQGFYQATTNVDIAGIPFDDHKSYQLGPVKDWERLTMTRRQPRRNSEALGQSPASRAAPIVYPVADLWQAQTERRKKYKIVRQDSDRAQQLLKQQISLNFKETPLAKVAHEIGKLLQLEICFDPRGLAAEDVAADIPVTIELSQDISLKSALHLILKPLHLDYVIEGGAIKITSEKLAASHSDGANLLTALDDKTELDFVDQPLSDVVEYLKERHDIEIQVDEQALTDSGVALDLPITRNAKGITLRSALRLVLGERDCTYVICGRVLMITSKTEAKHLHSAKATPAGDLVIPTPATDEGQGPGEGGDRYSRIIENPFLGAAQNPLATFSIDVDTASYAKVRRYLLEEGALPPPDAVRIEELVNYFCYDLPQPEGEAPLTAKLEAAACPWQPKHRLLRVSLKAREIAPEARPAANLVFLVDVSGSMEPDDKLPRVRRAMRLLAEQLREQDRVAIVVYAGSSGLVLPSTSGFQKDKILAALESLAAGGSTNGGEGLVLAYETAAASFIKGGVNRVILCTDGDFNVGVTSEGELERLIEDKARSGVFLTVLGFGMGNHNDQLLEKLADKGNGDYGYIDSEDEARKLLVEQAGGTLVTVAKDVKLQLEFNPRQVAAYRLIGYEDRLLRPEDFNNDRKDAGEIGAGHAVTALYELIPAEQPAAAEDAAGDEDVIEPLKYQRPASLTDAANCGELLSLKVKYKAPDAEKSKEALEFTLRDDGQDFGKASADFKFAAAVASFGMLLRNSEYKGEFTYNAVLEIAQEGLGADEHGYRKAFLEIVRKAKELAAAKSR